MKVHNLALVAAATLIFGAQGVAQSDNGLERALTELNAGLTAPAGSAGMAISGDARVRNHYNVAGDKKNMDARARMVFDFNVNEGVNVMLGMTAHSDWDVSGVDDMGSSAGAFDRYTVSAANLLGDGGTFTVGTQYFTLGSGRIIGSDSWDNGEQDTNSGIWYSNAGFNAFVLNGNDAPDDAGEDDTFGVSFEWTQTLPGIGDIAMSPYLIGSINGHSGSTGFETDFYGSELSGSAMGFGWTGEYVNNDGNVAWTASTSINIDALAGVPGIQGAAMDLSTSSADENFDAGRAIGWNQAGLADSALWANENVSSAGMSFSPMEGWNGRIARVDRDGENEWNLTASTTMVDAVDIWVGYANADAGDDSIWMTMSVNF